LASIRDLSDEELHRWIESFPIELAGVVTVWDAFGSQSGIR